MLILTLAHLIACGGCPEGSLPAADGTCRENAEPDGPLWDDQTLPGALVRPCELETPNNELNFETGCAGDACADMLFTEITAAIGLADCQDLGDTTACCEWDDHQVAYFDLEPGGNVVDEAAGILHVHPGYLGTTADGLGVGISMGCFIQVLGMPDDIEYTGEGDNRKPNRITYFDPRVTVYDGETAQSFFDQDGTVDDIFLHSP